MKTTPTLDDIKLQLKELLEVLQSVTIQQLDWERVATFKIDMGPFSEHRCVNWLNNIESTIRHLLSIIDKQGEALEGLIAEHYYDRSNCKDMI